MFVICLLLYVGVVSHYNLPLVYVVKVQPDEAFLSVNRFLLYFSSVTCLALYFTKI